MISKSFCDDISKIKDWEQDNKGCWVASDKNIEDSVVIWMGMGI